MLTIYQLLYMFRVLYITNIVTPSVNTQQTWNMEKYIGKNVTVNFALSSEMIYFTRFDSVSYLYHMFQQRIELRPTSDCMQELLQPHLYQYHGPMRVDTTTTAS
jgi:hypothetical protein